MKMLDGTMNKKQVKEFNRLVKAYKGITGVKLRVRIQRLDNDEYGVLVNDRRAKRAKE